MKLSISNIAWDSLNNVQVYKFMKNYGFTGLEIAPTKIFIDNPYEKLKEAKEWSKMIREEYGFFISSMQSIWFGREEKIFNSENERNILTDYTKKAIDFATVIGCGNLVFGCPKNRNIDKELNDESVKETAINFFKFIGDYANKAGTTIGMEANPAIYNTNFINDTLSALNLIKEVDSNGFLLNLDVGTMIQNEEKISELIGNIKYVNHIHISEPQLKIINKNNLHKELKEILKKENYNKFISVEMGKIEEVDKIERVMKYIWEVFKV